MFNYAIPETEQSQIGQSLVDYYNANVSEWRAGANNPNLPNAALIAQNIDDIERTISGYTEGRALNGTVDYTANLYTTYTFRGGALDGIGIGGGANFRGKNIIGNVRNQPFEYLYAKSYALATAHVSYSHRIGDRIRARYQINVSNLFNNRDVVFGGYSYVGALGDDFANGFRHQNPRRVMLTATFDF
jgi:hypothetical protein